MHDEWRVSFFTQLTPSSNSRCSACCRSFATPRASSTCTLFISSQTIELKNVSLWFCFDRVTYQYDFRNSILCSSVYCVLSVRMNWMWMQYRMLNRKTNQSVNPPHIQPLQLIPRACSWKRIAFWSSSWEASSPSSGKALMVWVDWLDCEA